MVLLEATAAAGLAGDDSSIIVSILGGREVAAVPSCSKRTSLVLPHSFQFELCYQTGLRNKASELIVTFYLFGVFSAFA